MYVYIMMNIYMFNITIATNYDDLRLLENISSNTHQEETCHSVTIHYVHVCSSMVIIYGG